MHHWSMCLFFLCGQNTLKLNQTGCHLNAILADNFHSQIFKSRHSADEQHVTEKDTHRQQWKDCFLTLWQCFRQQIKGIIHQTVISTLAVTNKAVPHIFHDRRLMKPPPPYVRFNKLFMQVKFQWVEDLYTQSRVKKWFALMPQGPTNFVVSPLW